MADLTPDVRDRASEAARKVDRDYGHWQDWVGSIDEFEHERALSTVDAVVAVVAPQIARPLQARVEELEVEREERFANAQHQYSEAWSAWEKLMKRFGAAVEVDLPGDLRYYVYVEMIIDKAVELRRELTSAKDQIDTLTAALTESERLAGVLREQRNKAEDELRAIAAAGSVLDGNGEKP